MAKIELPPGLTGKPTAGGTRYYWNATPRQRKAGWKGMALGADLSAAVRAAEARNAELARWEEGGARPRDVKEAVKRGTVGAMIDRFEAEHLPNLKASSRHEYKSALKVLRTWTADDAGNDGAAPLHAITRERAITLRKALFKPGKDGAVKRHRGASILRIARVLWQYGEDEGMVAANPFKSIRIPEPPARSRIISGPAIEAVMAAAVELKRPSVALGVLLGLWTLQRQGDILKWGEINWRPLRNVPDEARAVLQDASGTVMGFRLVQGKTGEPVEIALAGAPRAAIEAQLAANKQAGRKLAVIIADEDEDRAYPQWKFQRAFRAAVDHARAAAEAAGDQELVEDLTDIEYRDLRRTGMCLMREFGVPVEYIALISGHSIDRTKKILETYLPRNPRAAAQAMAMFVKAMQDRAAETEQQERSA